MKGEVIEFPGKVLRNVAPKEDLKKEAAFDFKKVWKIVGRCLWELSEVASMLEKREEVHCGDKRE